MYIAAAGMNEPHPLVILLTCPLCVAYLPSTFAMYCTMIALGAWFQRKRKV